MGFKFKYLFLPFYALGLYSWYSYNIYVLLPFSLLDFFQGNPTLLRYKEFCLSAFFMFSAMLIIFSSVVCGAIGDYLFYPIYKRFGMGRWKAINTAASFIMVFTVLTRGIFVVRWDYQHPVIVWIINMLIDNPLPSKHAEKGITITAIFCFIMFTALSFLGEIMYGVMDVSFYSFFNQNCPANQSGVVGGLIASGETAGFLFGVTIFGTLYPYIGKVSVNIFMGIYLLISFAPYILFYHEKKYKKHKKKAKEQENPPKIEIQKEKLNNQNNLIIKTSNLVPTISMNSINTPLSEGDEGLIIVEENDLNFENVKKLERTPIFSPNSPENLQNNQEIGIYKEKQAVSFEKQEKIRILPEIPIKIPKTKKFSRIFNLKKFFAAETWKRIIWWKDFFFLFVICIIQLNVIYAVEEFMAYYLTDIIRSDNFTFPVPSLVFGNDNLPLLPFGIQINWISFTRNVETAQSICMFVNNLTGTLASLIAGWVCQKWGPRLVLIVSLASAGIFSVFYSIFPNYFAMTVLQLIQGAADGIFFPSHLNYINNLFFENEDEKEDDSEDQKIGVGIAISSTAFAAPNIILTPFSGLILSLLKPFEKIYLFNYEIRGTNYKLLYMFCFVSTCFGILLILSLTDRKESERNEGEKNKKLHEKNEILEGKKIKYEEIEENENEDEFLFLK